MPSFTRKNDLVCWVYLSEDQQRIYEEFSRSEAVRELLNTTRSPLVALNVLKKICDHPRLLTNKQCHELNLDMDEEFLKNEEEMPEHLGAQSAVERINKLPVEQLVAESGKMKFLVELLDNLKSEGHRTLVFSMARRILDIVERVMKERGHEVARLDGTITKLDDREKIIERFTKNKNISVFLLTTQVGGVGLTITAADRVVIYDPSWNPATDAQAVDRCFRIGQDKNVVVYRLITCGSIEEKIYRRQVFKDSINKQTQGDAKNPYRYFTKMELRDLFMLDNTKVSTTQRQIEELHSHQRKTDTSLDAHIAFLLNLEMFGVSDHDLLFSKEAEPTEDHDLVEGDPISIESRAELAERMLAQESESNEQWVEEVGYYPAPEVFKDIAGAKRTMPSRWNFPGAPTETNKDDNNSDSDDNDVQVVLESTMNDLTLESTTKDHQGSDDGSFHDANETPQPVLSPQESNRNAIKQYLDRFKEKVYGTPDSSMESPATNSTAKLTPNSRGQFFMDKVMGYFSPKKNNPAAAAAAESPIVLNSPEKDIVEQVTKGLSVQQSNAESQSFVVKDSDDEDDVRDYTEVMNVEESPIADKSTGSPIVVGDSTDTTPVKPAANKFLQQALLKAKKGSSSSPISVDNTPVINSEKIPSSTEGTPAGVFKKSDNLGGLPRRPFENLSNSPQHAPLTCGERGDMVEDDFDLDLPPVKPWSTKKNKRRSVCALSTPRRQDDIPVSPSGSPPVDVIREELIVSPKEYDPIVAMSPARRSATGKTSSIEDVTLDGYEAFSLGSHIDSTILPDAMGAGAKRGTLVSLYEEDENGKFSSPAYQGKKKKARTSPPDEFKESMDVGEATPHRSGRNDTIDSDAGDTPVMRPTTTKRVLRIVESDEDMTDPENADCSGSSDEKSARNTSLTSKSERTTLQSHLKTFIEDTDDENEESEELEMSRSPRNTTRSNDNEERPRRISEDDSDRSPGQTKDENKETDEAEEQATDEDDEDEEEDDSESEEELDEETTQKYLELLKQSRELYKSGDYKGALSLCLDALEIYSGDEKAKRYAVRLQKLATQQK